METVFGLPAHPLIIHAVTVLLPLSAAGAVVIALSPTWRARIGWLVVGLAGLGVVAAWLAQESGEVLEEAIEEAEGVSPLLEAHTKLGDTAMFWVVPLFLVVLGFMAYHEYRKRNSMPALTPGAPIALALVALVVVASVATTVQVVRIGHSGAKATWEDVKIVPGAYDEDEEDEEHEGEEHEEGEEEEALALRGSAPSGAIR